MRFPGDLYCSELLGWVFGIALHGSENVVKYVRSESDAAWRKNVPSLEINGNAAQFIIMASRTRKTAKCPQS
jgi:hypothetical protein